MKDSLLNPNRYQSEKELSENSTNYIKRERKLNGKIIRAQQKESRTDSSTEETKDCSSVTPNKKGFQVRALKSSRSECMAPCSILLHLLKVSKFLQHEL